MKCNKTINTYASTASIKNLQNQIDDIMARGSGVGNAATWAQVNNTDLIPDSKISGTFAKAADLTKKADLVDGKVPVEQLPAATVGIVVGEGDNDAFAGSRGVALETKVTDLEATVSDKLGVDDVATWAKSEDPTLIPANKLDDHAVKYSDFSYVPGGESDPVERKTIQLANYDSISGRNVAGNDAANLIMMSKWDKVDIGSSRYPVNLNGSEFTLNDNRDIAKVYETNGLTNLEEGAGEDEIKAALGLAFEDLIEIIQDKNVVIVDRTSVGDYKTCIYATGNISGGNGGANLMFFIGTTPTIYQVQYVSGTFALAVIKYEFAKKSDIPNTSDFATKAEIPSLDGYATTQNISDSIAAEASARDKAIETATSNLVHNTLTVACKSLTENVTLASTDLTDGDELVKKDEILGTVVDESRNDTLAQKLVVRTYLPVQRRTDVTNKPEAEIFSEYFNASVTDRISLRNYLESNMAYISYNLTSSSIGYQYYKLPIVLADIPTTGDIKIVAMGPDLNNGDLLTKFTFTITLNGDSSSVHIEKKALES